jgi:RNA polymerase sigma-70 factor (ECF subfamily)
MRERSDEALMKAFAGGSMEAFEYLYQRHRSELYRYVLRRCGNPTTANDLFQGAWEKVIRARDQYRSKVPFRAWLYRIAHNHLVDYFRRLKPTDERPIEDLAASAPGPDQQAAVDARAKRLKQAIERLPGEQKDAFLLKLEGGLGIDEIAAVTGVNRETAKSRLRYATAKLNKMLKDDSTEPPDDL